MKTFMLIISNDILMVSVLSWFVAQLIKTILTLVTTRKLRFERLVGAGGMPSSHSALVCSLVAVVARTYGVESIYFAFAAVLAGIVMYDAMGVRRAAGEHAKILNKLVFKINLDPDEKDDEDEMLTNNELKEFLGHTPLEVLGGAVLGILIALIFPLN